MQSPEVKPVRYGWIAVIHFDSARDGGWIDPTTAARISGVSTAKLRRWAERGVISVIYKPGHQRRYYIPELHFLASWGAARREAGKAELRLPVVTDYIREALENGLAPKST